MDDQELRDELQRLRDAIALLANACGPHILSRDTAELIVKLLTRKA